jgi:hypothetical protein
MESVVLEFYITIGSELWTYVMRFCFSVLEKADDMAAISVSFLL